MLKDGKSMAVAIMCVAEPYAHWEGGTLKELLL